MVSSIVSREEYYGSQGRQFVNNVFGGSLPAFIAAFSQSKALTKEEINEIKRMIDTEGKV